MHIETELGTDTRPTTPGRITEALAALARNGTGSYVILLADEDTYLQTCHRRDGTGYVLEWQEGSVEHHFRADRALTLEQVSDALRAYLRDPGWRPSWPASRVDLSVER
jgi:hypothetical protein